MRQPPFLFTVACFLTALTSVNAELVAHYEFEETSGTILVDSTTNNYDGAVVGNGDLNVSGIVGSAYKPGGYDSYGRVAEGVNTFGIGGNHARTISFWFTTPHFDDQHRLIGIGSGPASNFSIVAEAGKDAGGANRIGLRYGNGNVFYDADNYGTAFATNTWYHVAVVYDGTNLDLELIGTNSDGNGLTFYVNGVVVNIAAGNRNESSQTLDTELSAFVFGANANAGEVLGSPEIYPGLLDDVRVYNSALSADQIASLAKPSPIIDSFTVDSERVSPGAQVKLSWKVANHDSLMIGWGIEGMDAPTVDGVGSMTLPVKETTEFTLIVSKGGICTSRSLRVVVGDGH